MTTVRDASVHGDAAALRTAMAAELQDNAFTDPRVGAALRAVPRHLFAPGEPLETAYAADRIIQVKQAAGGLVTSSLSSAHIQAVMLQQAGLEPGMNVLEIGSGGYNGALIQHVVGETGTVVSVDIDTEIVARARACLRTAGYDQVKVLVADAEYGVPQDAPFDRIIGTVCASDIPPAWLDQLDDAGRIVVPLRIRGLTRTVAFDRAGHGLVSRGYRLASFVAMQGAGARQEQMIPIDEGLHLRVDEDAPFDVEALRAAARGPSLQRWSGAAFDLPDELELFLITNMGQPALLHANTDLIDQGRFGPSTLYGVPVLVDGGSFAYRTKRDNAETGGYETGVYAYGPSAEAVAAQYLELLRRWARDHRRRDAACIRYTPEHAGTIDPAPGVVHTRHGTISVTWT